MSVHSTAQAIDFLRAMARCGYWLLSAIDPMKTGVIETKTFTEETSGAATAWINLWQGKRNIYFSANQPRTAMTVKAEKKDIGTMLGLHVDVDPVAPPEGLDEEGYATYYEEAQQAIYSRIMAYPVTPSVVVFSGGGYQAYWLLKAPIEVDGPEAVAQLEAYNRKLEKDLGGDHCFNVDRIMRLPGTINLPSKKKQAKGRRTVLAAVACADFQLVYELADFRPWAGADEKKATLKGATTKPFPKREPPAWCLRVIAQGPDTEGPKSYGGDRSRAVWAVCCELVRSGYSDEEIVAELLAAENGISEHVLEHSKPHVYAPQQAAKARETVAREFTLSPNTKKPIVDISNLQLAMAKLGIVFSHDDFRKKDLIEGPDDRPRRPMDDKGYNLLFRAINEKWGMNPSRDYLSMFIDTEAQSNKFHPVQDYLAGLKWDNERRIDSWLVDIGGAADTPYTRAVGAIVLTAAVRRVRHPGCKYDEIVILISPQGLDKSTALAVLAIHDDWFTDSLSLDADGKAVIESLGGKWIVEAAELKGMKGKDVEHLKALLSRQVDRGRMAYGHYVTEAPRQCVFFGTTNSDAFLQDTTGNRRFWPIRISKMDIARLRACRDQLWAEAAYREANGESIRLSPALYEAAALEQARRTVEDPWEGLIEKALGEFDKGLILAADVWTILNIPPGQQQQSHGARVGDAMRNLGWRRMERRMFGKRAWFYGKGSEVDLEMRLCFERSLADGCITVREEPFHLSKSDRARTDATAGWPTDGESSR